MIIKEIPKRYILDLNEDEANTLLNGLGLAIDESVVGSDQVKAYGALYTQLITYLKEEK